MAFRALGDLSEAAVAAFRRDAQSIDARIKALKCQIDALPSTSTNLDEVKRLQDMLRRRTLAEHITAEQDRGDVVALRKMLGGTIRSATIVERQASGPGGRTVWARALVEWTPAVALLLDEGLLTLGPAPVAPSRPSQRERAAERARRYRERKRMANGETPDDGQG